ncbi:MAG: peptide-methionine (S)-S-oxide reductase MsrA [Paracoccaceae bacterium]
MRAIALIFFILLGLCLQGRAEARDLQQAVFAGGCFWCVESDYESVDGVIEAVSGYTGGKLKNPTYKQVSRGGTGHFEAVQVTFDADVVSYRQLVDLFWRMVDPTDPNGQFCDRGDSYRTAVFPLTPAQAEAAKVSRAEAARALGRNIVTPILGASKFHPAEAYHQDYYKQTKRVLTRYGYISKAKAYKRYRKGCGRDKRLRALWGGEAFTVSHGHGS